MKANLSIKLNCRRIFQLLVIGILCFLETQIFAQAFKNTIIDPLPTSAVFAKYGNDQPSMQYGSINVPIPIFNIKTKSLEIPMSLTYQTSGINVTDTPFPAGYGWVFSQGFRITRTVLGRPDDMFRFDQVTGGSYEDLKPGIINTEHSNIHNISESNLFDSQKDIFNIHIPSGNYRFLINKVGTGYEAVTIGNQLKIEFLSPGATGYANFISGLKITDPQGNIYMFGYDAKVASTPSYTEDEGMSWCTAWMLKEITTSHNEKISFSWKKVNTNGFAARTHAPITVFDYKSYDCIYSSYEVSDPGGVVEYQSHSMVNSLTLEKIEFPNGSINFSYLSIAYPFLQSILVKDRNLNVVKNVALTYGSVNTSDGRLLQSLDINGEIHHFQYNPNRFPNMTTALDYWGYYNGKTTNITLTPAMTLQLLSGVTFGSNYSYPPNVMVPFANADRSVSPEHMKAFMMTKITYPTGGFSEFEYEPHTFAGKYVQSSGLFAGDPFPLTTGGGLRVTSIKTYANVGAIPMIKTYKYGLNEDGLANCSVAPTLDTFIDEYWHAYELSTPTCHVNFLWLSRRAMQINALSNYNKYLIDKRPIWYSKVTEYVNNEYKTEYDFDYPESYEIDWQLTAKVVKMPYCFGYGNLFTNGPMLKSTIYYNKQGSTYSPVKKITSDYEIVENTSINSTILDRVEVYSSLLLPGPDLYPMSRYNSPSMGDYFTLPIIFKILPYSIKLRYYRLKKSTTYSYENGQTLENYLTNFYNVTEPYIIKTINGSSIGGQEITTEFKYPFNFTSPIYLDMVTNNMVSPVIEQITSRGSTVIKKVKTNFTNMPSVTTGLILPASIETTGYPENTTTTDVTFEKYDSYGNILQKSYLNGPKVSYVWSYNNTYPVAEINNLDHGTMMTALGGQSALDAFSASNPSDGTVQSFLASLRAPSSVGNVMVNTYTYKPMLGISSSTDPKAMVTYFEYDSQGRLMNIRDHAQKITKSYNYHYKVP